jgi:hypothetical protein
VSVGGFDLDGAQVTETTSVSFGTASVSFRTASVSDRPAILRGL